MPRTELERKRMRRRAAAPYATCIGVLVLSLAVMASPGLAQSVSSARINGTVTDETGGALPGVTVTATSPALQVPEITTFTEADGTYRLVDLPAGVYRISYQLAGFSPFVREGVQLTVGFVASIDVNLSIGGLEQTVTVSGQSPVVDVTSTSASVAFTKEILDAVPRGRDMQNIFAMAPGVTAATPDVGGSTMAERQDLSSYGVASQPKLQVEGMNVAMGADQNTPIYFTDSTIQDVQIKTSGSDAEVSTPGISMVAVLKSGSNEFHGTYSAAYQSGDWQSSNLDDTLRAQGLTATQPLKQLNDVAADLGGPIMRERLWFYGAYSRQSKTEGLLGFAAGPGADGVYLTGDEPLADFEVLLTQLTAKLSYRLSQNNRLVYAFQKGTKAQPQNGAGRFRPLEATRDYENPTSIQKLELQSTITDRILLNMVGGYSGYITDYDAGRSFARPDAPSRQDLETGLWTGSHPNHQDKTRDRYQFEGSLSFFPENFLGGRHELKTGVMVYRDRSSDGYSNNLAGNYILYTDRINGVSGTPARIRIYNTPVVPRDNADTDAWYLKDTWRVTNALTVNLGVRWERQHSYLPEQSREAARDFPMLYPAETFRQIDVQRFNRFVPRVGIAWDLGGSTVVKATFGQYNYMLGDTFGDRYNANARAETLYLWHDLNGDLLYQPGEVDLDQNGPDFISTTGAKTEVINPDLRQPTTWETTASIERELAPSLGLRVMYVHRRLEDYLAGTLNLLRPYDAYTIPITRRDPGPDGLLDTSDDGGSVTFYDYRPEFQGAAFVREQLMNSPKDDVFHTVEGTLTKRLSDRWAAQVSYYVVKNHRWLDGGLFNSPNDEFFPVDETWNWAGTVTASYRMPWDVMVSGFLQSRSGEKGQRTYRFRASDPDGGPSIDQLDSVTLRLEPYGSQSLPAVNILNLRASKEFVFAHGATVGVDMDVFNVVNTNAVTGAQFSSGPTFGYAQDVIPARIARIGVRFEF